MCKERSYVIPSLVVEQRPDGWYIARQWSSSYNETPKWQGPYPTLDLVAAFIIGFCRN